MKTVWLLQRRLVLAAAALIVFAGSGLAVAGEARVVLVSIDGFAAYHLADESLELPHLRELIRSGVQAESSETVFPSVTHPSHTTIVTGVLPRTHGVVGNRLRNRETGERFHVTNLPRAESVRVPTSTAASPRCLPKISWPIARQPTRPISRSSARPGCRFSFRIIRGCIRL